MKKKPSKPNMNRGFAFKVVRKENYMVEKHHNHFKEAKRYVSAVCQADGYKLIYTIGVVTTAISRSIGIMTFNTEIDALDFKDSINNQYRYTVDFYILKVIPMGKLKIPANISPRCAMTYDTKWLDVFYNTTEIRYGPNGNQPTRTSIIPAGTRCYPAVKPIELLS